MTTPANDETKKEEKVASSTGTPPAKDADSAAPKKRKRKRKSKKSVTPAVTATKETTKDEKQHTAPDKADTAADEHAKKPVEPKEKETKNEAKKEAKKEEPTDKKTSPEETKKPNLDIKSEAHMLPGIDNIHEYIARKKATSSPSHEKKEAASSFITPDGTDLLTLPKLYAVVPHSKGDHKLVYMKTDAPAGLIDDPRKRIPGNMYVKNGRDIYMVTLTMKEHPTLKDEHGEAYDVWVIDTPEQLTEQINAIKQGMGGGENFGEVVAISSGNKPSIPESAPTEEEMSPKEDSEAKESKQIKEEQLPEIDEVKDQEVDPQVVEAIPGIVVPELELAEENISTDIPETAIDTIDLSLPSDEELPEIDTEQVIPEIDFTPQETEVEQSDEITLDMDISSAEESTEGEQPTADSVSNEEQPIESIPEEQAEEITLDMSASELSDENNQESNLHFATPEIESDSGTSESSSEEAGSLFIAPQDISVSLPTEEEHAEGGMFRDPSVTNTVSETTIPPEEEHPQTPAEPVTTSQDPFFSSHETKQMPGTTSTDENTTSSSEAEKPIPEEQPRGASNSFDLDDLSIESSGHAGQSIDLDNLPTSGSTIPIAAASNDLSSHSRVAPSKSKFPFHIVIRIVLFLLIAGALVLVRKVMFPAIKGAKPVDNSEVSTGQLIEDNEQMSGDTLPIDTPPTTSGTTLPSDEPDTDDNEINTPPENTGDTPAAGLTLNELTAKLQSQQTEARKVLNIAKLLENKQAIKFSLAAMLKAGNVLERIETEPTITAQDVFQESEKIDRYLMDANKLIE